MLFIVLDSADAERISEWAGAGYLPNLQRLSDSSVVGRVKNRPGVYVVGTWISMATGYEPVKHGRHSWIQFDPNTYEIVQPDPDDNMYPLFWQALDLAGKRVAVIDIPRVPLLKLQHGVQVVDWFPHDYVYGRLQTLPRNLGPSLISKYGLDPCEGGCDKWPKKSASDYLGLVDVMRNRITAKVALFEELWTQSKWDLFSISFSEAHCIGHQCWHIQEASHDWYQADLARVVKTPVLSVYQSLDAAVGRLLEVAGPQTTVVVLANPGMGLPYHGQHLMERALTRINRTMPHGRPSPIANEAHGGALDFDGSLSEGTGLDKRTLRRAREKSFSVPIGNSHFAVRVNVVDRERFGRVRRGVELNAYLNELTQELLALRHTEDGRAVFEDPIRTSVCYGTGDDHNLPDLMLRWRRDRPIVAIESSVAGALSGLQGRQRSGDHRPIGRYWLKQPGKQPGHGEEIRDIDIGVTIGAMLGERTPGTDGRVARGWPASESKRPENGSK